MKNDTDEQIAEFVLDMAKYMISRGARNHARIADLIEVSPYRQKDVQRALIALHNERLVLLEPEPLNHRVDQRAKDAAIHLGGEDRHLVVVR